MASCNTVLKSESKSKSIPVSTSAQTQHFSSLELLLDSYMPEMALFSKWQNGGWARSLPKATVRRTSVTFNSTVSKGQAVAIVQPSVLTAFQTHHAQISSTLILVAVSSANLPLFGKVL